VLPGTLRRSIGLRLPSDIENENDFVLDVKGQTTTVRRAASRRRGHRILIFPEPQEVELQRSKDSELRGLI